MLETPHVVVGAAIASKIGGPLLSLPLAFLSHFVVEKVPHWNPHLNYELKQYGRVTPKSFKIILLDSSIALTSGSILALRALPDTKKVITIFLACFLSILPDLIEAPYFFLKYRRPWISKYISLHKLLQADAKPLFGLATQVLVILTSLLWIYS